MEHFFSIQDPMEGLSSQDPSEAERCTCTEELSSTLKDNYLANYQPIQRIDIPQSKDKTYQNRTRQCRRYSSPTGPPNMQSSSTKPTLSIPEVVITDHDEVEKETRKPPRIFKRSLSTPEALKPCSLAFQDDTLGSITSPNSSISSITSTGPDGTYVTLEDVAPFKFRGARKMSTSSSIFSTGDDRIYLSEDAWSYTNCSSDTKSVRTDTDAGSDTDERKVSDPQMTGELVDLYVSTPRVNGDCDAVTLELVAVDSKGQEEGLQTNKEKSSRWKKLSRMVKWTPFIQVYRKRKYPWVQLAGHSGSFIRGSQGTVLKKCGDQEERCYRLLMQDPLSLVVPTFHRNVVKEGRKYLEISCCLSEFTNPSIMDIKMGVRTFLTGETSVSKPRCDLYEKMISEDHSAPTPQEQQAQAITKYRYLDWRDCISSSRNLGFRIEATTSKGKSTKDFKSVKMKNQVEAIFTQFSDQKSTTEQYLERLKLIKSLCYTSPFFSRHEMIGSSLLFIHDDHKASIWMIDFEKSTPVPLNQAITHSVPWEHGTREDGYLIGLNSLISIFQDLADNSV